MGPSLVIGEALVDLIPNHAGWYSGMGGGAANVAVNLARQGVDVALVSHVGTDAFGSFVVERLAGEGVQTQHIVREPAHYTGLVVLHGRDIQGRAFSAYRHRTADTCFGPQDLPDGDYPSIHMAMTPMRAGEGRALMERVVSEHAGALLSGDANLRPHLWESHDVCRQHVTWLASHLDIFKANEGEGRFLTGAEPEEAARQLAQRGAGLAVVTVGERGAVWATAESSGWIEPPEVTAVDAIGAGDAFMSGLIAARLAAATLEAALENATRMAGLAVARVGAV